MSIDVQITRLPTLAVFITTLTAALIPCSLQAQTRLYLPSTGTAAVSPTFSAGWEDTGGVDRVPFAVTSGGTTPQTVVATTDTNNTIDTDQLIRQYVSPPFNGAFILTGTVKGQIKASESTNAQNACAQVVVYIVSNDGSTVRGTALDFETGALSSEFSSSNVNRRFPLAAISPAALTSVSVQDCDRLVIEYGSRNHATGTGAQVRLILGDDSAIDLADANETSTATADPWVEFSATLTFRAEGACGGGGAGRRLLVTTR